MHLPLSRSTRHRCGVHAGGVHVGAAGEKYRGYAERNRQNGAQMGLRGNLKVIMTLVLSADIDADIKVTLLDFPFDIPFCTGLPRIQWTCGTTSILRGHSTSAILALESVFLNNSDQRCFC